MQISFPKPRKKLSVFIIAQAIGVYMAMEGYDIETILTTLSPALAFLPAQGLADIGKERAAAQAT